MTINFEPIPPASIITPSYFALSIHKFVRPDGVIYTPTLSIVGTSVYTDNENGFKEHTVTFRTPIYEFNVDDAIRQILCTALSLTTQYNETICIFEEGKKYVVHSNNISFFINELEIANAVEIGKQYPRILH